MKSEIIQAVFSLLALAIVFFGLLVMRVRGTSTHKKLNLLYILTGGVCLGILALVRFAGLAEKVFLLYILLQVLVFGLGFLHNHYLFKLVPWAKRTSFWGPLLITLSTMATGGALMLLAFEWGGMEHFHFIMLSSLAWFLVPVVFISAVEHYFAIPQREMKTWNYPLDQQIADPTDAELASPLVISFEFTKKADDPTVTIFRAKAPKDIEFGKLFYFFINDYNSRHPEGMIEFAGPNTGPHPWVFSFKRKWYSFPRFLDPSETVYHNHIKENSIIVCERILQTNN